MVVKFDDQNVQSWERVLPPFLGRGAGPNLAQCSLDQGPPLCQVPYLDPPSRLATDMGRKLGRGAGSPSNTKSPGPSPSSTPSGILIHQLFGLNRYGPKIGGFASLWERGDGSPSSIMWPGPRPICVPSFILIRITIWPQYTNVTDRTGQTDNGLIA